MASRNYKPFVERAMELGIDPFNSYSGVQESDYETNAEFYMANIAAALGFDPQNYDINDIAYELGLFPEDYEDEEDEFEQQEIETINEQAQVTETDNAGTQEGASTSQTSDQGEQTTQNSAQKDTNKKNESSNNQSQENNKSQQQNKLKNNQNNRDNAPSEKNYRKKNYNKPNQPQVGSDGVSNPSNSGLKGTKNTPKPAAKAATKPAPKVGGGAKQGLKEGAKNAANAVKEGFKTLAKNPKFWIAIGILALVIVIFLVITAVIININSSNGEYYEQFPYSNLKVNEKVKVKIGNNIYELTLDEATAAVLEHEDPGLTKSMEYLKARAIASRSRIVYEMHQSSYKKNGYILSGDVLGFKRTSKNSKFQKAADETSGVILISGSVSNPNFACIEWDNICHSASKGGKETDNSFIVCQKKVEVPFSFLKKYSYYTIDYWRKQVGHGRGMSQWGAYYLAIEKNYDAVKLLNYFYDNNTIVTFYQPTSTAENKTSSGECKALSSISSTPSGAKKPTSSLKTLLKNKGTSVTSFNNGLLNAVLDAGSGTRCAVVTAAVYSIKNLASYGYRIPYSQPGYSVTHYGISGNWGQKACSGCKYDIKGLDCGTFVQWAFYNGGVNLGFNQFKNKGKNVGYTEGKPGDVLYYRSTDGKNGHVMLILKYNSKKKGYYVAQAAGKSYGNTKINFVNTSYLKNNNYKVKDMSSYYCAKSGCGKSKTKSNSQLKKAFN